MKTKLLIICSLPNTMNAIILKEVCKWSKNEK